MKRNIEGLWKCILAFCVGAAIIILATKPQPPIVHEVKSEYFQCVQSCDSMFGTDGDELKCIQSMCKFLNRNIAGLDEEPLLVYPQTLEEALQVAGQFRVGDYVNCGAVGYVVVGTVKHIDAHGIALVEGKAQYGGSSLDWHEGLFDREVNECWIIEKPSK